MGWALSGACPGPMVVNIGFGYYAMLIVFFFAVLGTFLYGYFRDKSTSLMNMIVIITTFGHGMKLAPLSVDGSCTVDLRQ